MIQLAVTTMFSYDPVLGTHEVVGILVFVLAIGAIFAPWARRLVLYALAAQVAVGAIVWSTLKLSPPLAHWLPALLVGGLYAMANASERRGRPAGLVRGLLVLGAVVLGLVYYAGEHAMRAGSLP